MLFAKVRTGNADNRAIVTLAASESVTASQIRLLRQDANEDLPCDQK